MPVLTLAPEDEDARLDHARDWLAGGAPGLSARTLVSKRQKVAGLIFLAIVLIGLVISPINMGIVLVALATLFYVAIVANRVGMTLRSLRHPNLIVVSDEEALAIPDHALPLYTVLVPIYREAAVVPQLVEGLRAIDYPRDRLDVKLLVEWDDTETISASMAHAGGEFEVIVVPDGEPRT